jgi:hypothetical protein
MEYLFMYTNIKKIGYKLYRSTCTFFYLGKEGTATAQMGDPFDDISFELNLKLIIEDGEDSLIEVNLSEFRKGYGVEDKEETFFIYGNELTPEAAEAALDYYFGEAKEDSLLTS